MVSTSTCAVESGPLTCGWLLCDSSSLLAPGTRWKVSKVFETVAALEVLQYVFRVRDEVTELALHDEVTRLQTMAPPGPDQLHPVCIKPPKFGHDNLQA